MIIKPLGNRILVTEDAVTTTTSSGIIIEGTSKDTKIYTIVGTGRDVEYLHDGDKVYIDITKATVVLHQGKLHALIAEPDVLALLK